MFNLGFWEMIVLAVIALVVVGPEKLPSMARKLGQLLNDLKRTTNTLTSEINSSMDEESFQKSAPSKEAPEVDAAHDEAMSLPEDPEHD